MRVEKRRPGVRVEERLPPGLALVIERSAAASPGRAILLRHRAVWGSAAGHACRPPRSRYGIAKRIGAIDERLPTADPLTRLHLVQARMDLERELAGTEGQGTSLDELEAAFVQAAAAYGERIGLTYDAWRSIGVEPRVLKAAGIGRS